MLVTMRSGDTARDPFLAAQFALMVGPLRSREGLGRVALALLLDALDRRLDAGEMRVDGERPLEGLERRLVAVEREIDLTKTGERAKMMRLQLQRALDIGDARLEIAEDVIDGGALVPALGEIGAALNHGIEDGERLFGTAVGHRLQPALHHRVDLVIGADAPDLPDDRLDNPHLAIRRPP